MMRFALSSLRHKAAVLLLPALLSALLSAAVPLGMAAAQPVGLPDLGDSAADDLSPLVEQQLGDAIMAESMSDPAYIDDPYLLQYFNGIAHRLAATAPPDTPTLHVFPVNDPTINAFTMPGGYIGVQSGLVVATESEAELAGVIAHEIGHVIQRHLARNAGQGRQSMLIMLASLAAALAAASMGGGGQGAMGALAFGQAAAVDRQLNYSRNIEREADRVGFSLLQNAGYNANGMAEFFERLARLSGANESTSQALMRDHPLSVERMSDMQDRARNVAIINRPDSNDYFFARARLRVLQANDMQARLDAVHYFDSQVAADPEGMRRAADYYGMALAWYKLRDYAKAADALAKASAGGIRTHPMMAGLGIDLAVARKDPDRALALAREAYARWPDQRGLVLALADVLQKTGRSQESIDLLKAKIAHDDDPHYQQALAYGYEKLGKKVEQDRSMAAYYEQIGTLAPAIELLQQARAASRDFYEQSQIDAQLRELMRKDKEQRDLLKRFQS